MKVLQTGLILYMFVFISFRYKNTLKAPNKSTSIQVIIYLIRKLHTYLIFISRTITLIYMESSILFSQSFIKIYTLNSFSIKANDRILDYDVQTFKTKNLKAQSTTYFYIEYSVLIIVKAHTEASYQCDMFRYSVILACLTFFYLLSQCKLLWLKFNSVK